MEVRNIIQADSIRMFFQPIVDLFLQEVIGYELLARGPVGIENPEELFSLSEDQDCEAELDYACRAKALSSIASLGSNYANCYFFLNVSPRILNSAQFRSGFTRASIQTLGINHSKIVLEITEKASIDNHEDFERLIKHYVDQGFKIALDDFGAGHSGLTTLIAAAPHLMKIDKEIIRNIHRNTYKQKLVKAIVSFGSSVGSNVLAEGIESIEELQAVYDLGIQYVQGYFLGYPKEKPETLSDKKITAIKSLRYLKGKHYSSANYQVGASQSQDYTNNSL